MMTLRELIDRTEATLVLHYGQRAARDMIIYTAVEISSSYRGDRLQEFRNFTMRVSLRRSDSYSGDTDAIWFGYEESTDDLLEQIRNDLPPQVAAPRPIIAETDDVIDGVIPTSAVEEGIE